MPDLEQLISELGDRHADVVRRLNKGTTLVDFITHVEALTRAAGALLDYAEIGGIEEKQAHRCEHCGHHGFNVSIGSDYEDDDRRNQPKIIAQCDDVNDCRARRRARLGYNAVPAPRPGDIIAPTATDIHPDVLEFIDETGDTWRRAEGPNEATHDGVQYAWVTPGGWSTTEGRLGYAPLRITKVKEPTDV